MYTSIRWFELTSWVQTPLMRGFVDTTLSDKVCQWLAAGRWICSTSQFLPYIKCHEWFWGGGGGMVFIDNFNNISVILLQSVL
jgi:hypothetical protein